MLTNDGSPFQQGQQRTLLWTPVYRVHLLSIPVHVCACVYVCVCVTVLIQRVVPLLVEKEGGVEIN